MEKKLISIIMPTFNSEETIIKALDSIRAQDIDQNQIEILVIDGGSTDKTIEIAKKYGALILKNKARLPEYAKKIGINFACGSYIIMQDSDEVYTTPKQLSDRIKLFESNPEVKVLLADEFIYPKNYGFSCAYLVTQGDPFSFFIYRSKGSITKSFNKNIKEKNKNACVLEFGENEILPIGDGGTTMVDMDFLKENYREELTKLEFSCTVANEVIAQTGFAGCVLDDRIVHYSKAGFSTYLKKLKFRVYNNIFFVKESGYSARAVSNRSLKRRKFLFIPYCISIIAPFFDAIKLTIRYKNATMLMHFFYVYYVFFQIILQYGKKILGGISKSDSYG